MGLLFAVITFGIVAICVGETIGELVQLFPTRNAIFQYIHTFVDHDVAWATGILYWLTYSAIIPFQVLTASRLLEFWFYEGPWPILFALVLAPVILVTINILPVKVCSRPDLRFSLPFSLLSAPAPPIRPIFLLQTSRLMSYWPSFRFSDG